MVRLELKQSQIAGTGCYACEDIPEGTCVGEYLGEVITDEEADRRYADLEHTYLFSRDDGMCIDAMRETHFVKYVNHSCDPSCEAREEDGRIFYWTLRPIREGEELTVDYQLIAGEDDEERCMCGASSCRGTMKPKHGSSE